MNYIQPQNTPDNYFWFQNLFNSEELLKLEKDLVNLKVQVAKLGPDGSSENEEIRKSKVNFIPNNEKWNWLYLKLINASVDANDALWHFDLHTASEQIQYTEYHATEKGHYTWHMDCGPGTMSHRKISITIQMSESDEYAGGDLELWTGGKESIKAPRGKGVAVLFPSYILHRVSPVTDGIRKSLVLWVGGSHYR